MSSLAAKHNVGLDLSGKVAVVSGGTQGIGAGVSKRFAKAGASVYIVGRNEKLGNQVVEELKALGGAGKTYEFIKADLSSPKGVKEVAATLQKKAGASGINFLVQTQGGPPTGKIIATPEGNESHFAVQILSRFGLAYLLTKNNVIKEAIVNVAAPSGPSGTAPNVDDLQLLSLKDSGKWTVQILAAQGANDGNVNDGVTTELNRRFPSIHSHHIFPGIVTTNAGDAFPFPIPLIFKLAGPVISRTFGNSADSYADIPVYLAANPKSRSENLTFTQQKLTPIEGAPWLKDEQKTRAIWDKLVEIGGF